MLPLSTVRRWTVWAIFWIMFDIFFFTINMLSGHVIGAVLFAVMAALMVVTYLKGRPRIAAREAADKECAATVKRIGVQRGFDW